jgi:hypothetical protein
VGAVLVVFPHSSATFDAKGLPTAGAKTIFDVHRVATDGATAGEILILLVFSGLDSFAGVI